MCCNNRSNVFNLALLTTTFLFVWLFWLDFWQDFWPGLWPDFWPGFWPDFWPGFWPRFWPGFWGRKKTINTVYSTTGSEKCSTSRTEKSIAPSHFPKKYFSLWSWAKLGSQISPMPAQTIGNDYKQLRIGEGNQKAWGGHCCVDRWREGSKGCPGAWESNIWQNSQGRGVDFSFVCVCFSWAAFWPLLAMTRRRRAPCHRWIIQNVTNIWFVKDFLKRTTRSLLWGGALLTSLGDDTAPLGTVSSPKYYFKKKRTTRSRLMLWDGRLPLLRRVLRLFR